MTKVTVVTGHLGAGKTTLLNRWLSRLPSDDVAVIVNEVGAVGIDAELLAERARTIREITGGCICCSTHGELVRALREVASRRRVFIETSGAASPAGVVRAVRGNEELRLDGIVTVVDGRRAGVDADDLAIEQIAYADIVVLSRADLASDGELDASRAFVARVNSAAVLATEEQLDDLLGERAREFEPASSHVSSMESVALVHDGEVDEERFGTFIEEHVARYAGRIVRMKGLVAIAGVAERMVLQGVGGELEVSFAKGPRTTKLVIIGYGLEEAGLRSRFMEAVCAGE